MRVTAAATAVLLALFLDLASASSVTPVEKVVELLHGMLKKAQTAQHEEVLQWTAYKRWCSDSEFDKQNLVKAADLTIESLRADVEKHDLEVERLRQLVEGHQSDIVVFKADLKHSIEQRVNDSRAYEVTHADYSESIHAIVEAIKVLKEQAYNRPQAIAMLQHLHQRAGLLEKARHAIEASLAQASESADVAFISALGSASDVAAFKKPGEAHGYEFQSGGITDMLEELQDKFTVNLRDLEKAELTSRQTHEREVLDLNAQITAAEHEIQKNTKHQAESRQASADASARLTEILGTRKEDADFLEDLKLTCNQKSDDFDARQQLRAEEVEALGKAITILTGTKVAGAAKEHLPTLVQRARQAASFLQLRPAGTEQTAASRAPANVTSRIAMAAAFMQKESARIGSQVLAMLAVRMHDEPDVFAKVKKIIQDLITRLQEEATNEATHKAWCDKELSTNEQTRTTKSSEVQRLHYEIDQITSKVAILKRELAELSKAVAVLTAEMAEAANMRIAERDQNQATIADAVGAQMAVGDAIRILQDYYGKVSQSVVLVQQKQQMGQAPVPPIFDKPFKGQQTENDNIIAFLNVIQSDFARLESEVEAAEQKAQSEYDRTTLDAKADKDAKEGAINTKQGELTTEEAALVTAQNDLDLEQADLDAALAYYDKLRPSCIEAAAEGSYKERIQRREEEVASLKEALEILNGQSIVSGPDSVYSSVDGGNRGWDIGITADAGR